MTVWMVKKLSEEFDAYEFIPELRGVTNYTELAFALPNKIAVREHEYIKLQEKIANEKNRMVAMELKYEREIAEAKTEDGKALFSNDVKRKAELQERLSKDVEYEQCKITYSALQRTASYSINAINFLTNQFSAVRAILRGKGD